MARTRKALPAKVGVALLISAGVLAGVRPRVLIEDVPADTRKASQRERLPPALGTLGHPTQRLENATGLRQDFPRLRRPLAERTLHRARNLAAP